MAEVSRLNGMAVSFSFFLLTARSFVAGHAPIGQDQIDERRDCPPIFSRRGLYLGAHSSIHANHDPADRGASFRPWLKGADVGVLCYGGP
jgi:hypothetical protein